MANFFTKLFTKAAETRATTPATTTPRGLWQPFSFVNTSNELAINAVYSAVKLISDHIAVMPFDIIEKIGDKNIKRNETEIGRLLRTRPNTYTNSFNFQKSIVVSLLLRGNAYARITRNNQYKPTALYFMFPSDVEPFIHTDAQKYYHIRSTGEVLTDADVLHFINFTENGVKGLSVIAQQRTLIEKAHYEQNFGKQFFENGANVGGVVETEKNFTEDQYNRLLLQLRDYEGNEKAHKLMLLEGGAKYNKIGIPPEDAQFLQTRRMTIEDVARMFNLPAAMIGHLDGANFASLEQLNTMYVYSCLLPISENLQQEYKYKLFTLKEQNKIEVNQNFDALLKGDISTRTAYYQTMFGIGAFSQNDILRREGENPIPNGDRYYIPANNLVPIDKIDEFQKTATNE